MNRLITSLNEKMDDGYKALKWLKEGWNKIQLELDELRNMQDTCEWKGET
jgi:hypothetical protein